MVYEHLRPPTECSIILIYNVYYNPIILLDIRKNYGFAYIRKYFGYAYITKYYGFVLKLSE